MGIDKFERYIELSDGAERINHSELMKDLSEIRGFRASERQRAQYDRVMEWFRLRGRSKNAVTF